MVTHTAEFTKPREHALQILQRQGDTYYRVYKGKEVVVLCMEGDATESRNITPRTSMTRLYIGKLCLSFKPLRVKHLMTNPRSTHYFQTSILSSCLFSAHVFIHNKLECRSS